jgi:hypothetical protein
VDGAVVSGAHALLIGIDGYLPNAPFGPGKGGYEQLPACGTDVRAMADYLAEEVGVRRITLLTASRHEEGELPPEPRERWPTYENMVEAFHRITREAAPGDQVYIHYAGHGGVVPTAVPEVKGPRESDETLVPVDIGEPGARHLRDIELALLLRRMTERELYVTLVLDCCHSGGALRSGGFVRGPNGEPPRGIPNPDPTARPFESLAGTWEEIRAVLGPARKPGQRDAAPASLLRAQNAWVTLTACQANQQAYTLVGEDGVRHGVLSHEWLAALSAASPGATYQEIYDRVVPKIRERPSKQTPMLYGEGDRVVFGKDRIPRRSTVAVTSVLPGGREVKLNTGGIHGVVAGSRFGLYPAGCELIAPAHRQAVVEVTKLGAMDSLARVVGPLPDPPLGSGTQATLEHPGSVRLQAKVRVVEPEGRWLSVGRRAADALKTLLLEETTSFVRLAAGMDAADFTVIPQGEAWEIRDAWGQPLAFPLVPPIPFSTPEPAKRVVSRLEQLTKFRNVDRLVHPNPEVPLSGRLGVEWTGHPESGPLVLRKEQTADLRIANHSHLDLHVIVLVLRSDGSIQRAFLGSERAQSILLRRDEHGQGRGEERTLEMSGELFSGEGGAFERLKVFGFRKGWTQFGWLELPPWDGKPRPRPAFRRDDSLEVILASLAGEWPAKREVLVSGAAAQDWTLETLELRIEA